MTTNGYNVFDQAIARMNPDQINRLDSSIKSTFLTNCKSKQKSFAMQNMVKNVCMSIQLKLINLVIIINNSIYNSKNDLVKILMVHKFAN